MLTELLTSRKNGDTAADEKYSAQLEQAMTRLGRFVHLGGGDQRLQILLDPGNEARFENNGFLGDDGLFHAALVVLDGLAFGGIFQSGAALDVTGTVGVGFDNGIIGNIAGKLHQIQVSAAQDNLVAVVDGVFIAAHVSILLS